MCNACGNVCCGMDSFQRCGCDDCHNEACHSSCDGCEQPYSYCECDEPEDHDDIDFSPAFYRLAEGAK